MPASSPIDKSLEDPNYLSHQSETAGFDEFVDGKLRVKFKRLAEHKPGESWIPLIYGPSKTGKTFLAGTSGPRTLYINTGGGIETLLAPAFRDRYPESKDIIMVDVRDQIINKVTGEIEYAFDVVADVIHHSLKHFPNKFDWVILDDATFTRASAMNKAMTLNTAARTRSKRADRSEEFVGSDIQDYKLEMEMIEWLLAQFIPIFKGHQKNLVVLAHERQIFQKAAEIGGEPTLKRVVPGFTGKTFPDKVPSFFDDVMHTEVITDGSGHSEYRLQTAGNSVEIGGTRHGGIFPSVIKDPNLKVMLEMIRKSQKYEPKSMRK